MSLKTAPATVWREAARRLASRIDKAVAGGQIKEGPGRWITFTENDLPQVDILEWLSCQSSAVMFYWRDRQRQHEVAGLGTADVISDESNRLPAFFPSPDAGDLSYFGGCRFDPSYPENLRSESWRCFGDGLYVLPLIQLKRNGDNYSISCHLDRTTQPSDFLSDISSELLELAFEQNAGSPPGITSYCRTDRPDRSGWTCNVESALKMFEDGKAEKIVLARETTMQFERDLNPWQLLKRLLQNSESTYAFGFQPAEGAAFIGASPESLYTRLGHKIASEAIAGTRPRGLNEAGDLRLAEELLNSEKDRREHDLVAQCIVDDLQELSEGVTSDASPTILKQSRVQHLYKRIRAILISRIKDGDLLTRLHPTPAVGGYPRQVAVETIRNLEGFDRGWYAGPIGWLSPDEADFAVGIRSGLVQGRTLTLYSGAGIVPGSEAQKEWDEIEHKMSGFLEAVAGKKI